MTDILETIKTIIGEKYVIRGADMSRWSADFTGKHKWEPTAVLRPGSREEIAEILGATYAAGIAVVPVSGNTSLAGGTSADGVIMISVDRLNQIDAINTQTRSIRVGAGAILQNIHAAADEAGMIFPLTFGARGSAMIGGNLSTNAGGSNVVRYGNTRDLCLGLEVVLPDGQIMDLMTDLHKDNTGLNLKHLFIGAEGSLGMITAATLKLHPKPAVYATAMIAMSGLDDALALLNDIQMQTGGGVEAFEYMPRAYFERHKAMKNGGEPFDAPSDVNILCEVASTRPRDAASTPEASSALLHDFQNILAEMMEAGKIQDAVIAQNEAQRAQMWERREAAAELTFDGRHTVDADIALPLDQVPVFLEKIAPQMAEIDPGAETFQIAHLGDGNIHYTVYPTNNSDALYETLITVIEDQTRALGGSFSAEHGIGKAKLSSMRRQKDPVALATMRAIKQAIDPKGLMNPGKVIP